MNRDLEEQVNEMGPEYREVVGKLLSAYRPIGDLRPAAPEVRAPRSESRRGRIVGWTAAYLVAASLLVFAGLAVLFRASEPEGKVCTVRAGEAATEYSLAYIRNDKAIREMIRTQNPDGSWKTDFLTRQNALALAECEGAEAKLAYRKAMRNLRRRGIL